MDEDEPDTQAQLLTPLVVIVPTRWLEHTERLATIEVVRIEVAAIDFYPEPA